MGHANISSNDNTLITSDSCTKLETQLARQGRDSSQDIRLIVRKVSSEYLHLQPNHQQPTALKSSQCHCAKIKNETSFMMCSQVKKWIQYAELHTYRNFDYEKTQAIYDKLSQIEIDPKEEKQIKRDILRTYPEITWFQENNQGYFLLLETLKNLCRLPSSNGYLQGLNYIAASLLYHSDQVIAFGLLDMALNDYHLKLVYMPELPGMFMHAKIIDCIVQDQLKATVGMKFQELSIKAHMYASNWIICLFSQSIPVDQMQRFYIMFFRDGWTAVYRIILCILTDIKDHLKACTLQSEALIKINQSQGHKLSFKDNYEKKQWKSYWQNMFSELEGKSTTTSSSTQCTSFQDQYGFKNVNKAYVDSIKEKNGIL